MKSAKYVINEWGIGLNIPEDQDINLREIPNCFNPVCRLLVLSFGRGNLLSGSFEDSLNA